MSAALHHYHHHRRYHHQPFVVFLFFMMVIAMLSMTDLQLAGWLARCWRRILHAV